MEKDGLENILRTCQTQGVRRLVYVTAIGTEPDGPSAWSRERWQIEQFLFDSGLDVSVFRPGMIVGRGGNGFDTVIRGAKGPVAIAIGSRTRRFRTVDVDDVADYLIGDPTPIRTILTRSPRSYREAVQRALN